MVDRIYDDEKFRVVPRTNTSRFVVEGTWSGYRPTQERVVHREVVSKKRAERLRCVSTIVYGDGTTLSLTVRPTTYRERVFEIKSYTSLVKEAEKAGCHTYVIQS